MRIPLAALGPVSRRRLLGILLPLLALAAAATGVLVGRGGDDVDRAAKLAAPDTALWIRVDPGDAVWEVAEGFTSLRDRYGLEGIPLIIDFVERKQRGRR